MNFTPKGIITALITPTDRAGNLKEPSTRKLLKYVIEGGVHGLFPLSTNGEFYALDFHTKIRMSEITVEEAGGRIPVYMGAASNTTRESVELAKAAEKLGADAVTVLTPSFIKLNDNELYNHYARIAAATNLPVFMHSFPARTGILISSHVVSRLSEIDNIRGIKDGSGNLDITEQYIRCSRNNFSVLAGNDMLILATLVYGGVGAMSASANIAPRLVASIYDHYAAGDLEKAREAQSTLGPLRRAFSLGSIPVAMLKEAAALIAPDSGSPVAPVEGLTDDERGKLKEVLKALGL